MYNVRRDHERAGRGAACGAARGHGSVTRVGHGPRASRACPVDRGPTVTDRARRGHGQRPSLNHQVYTCSSTSSVCFASSARERDYTIATLVRRCRISSKSLHTSKSSQTSDAARAAYVPAWPMASRHSAVCWNHRVRVQALGQKARTEQRYTRGLRSASATTDEPLP